MKFQFLFPFLVGGAALSGCLGNSGESLPPPTGIKPVVGDGIVGVTWTSEPDVSYLVFGSTKPNLTTLNWLDAGIAGFALNNQGTKAQPPTFLCGAPNGATYYFVIDAHTGTAPGGASSPAMPATGRSAGGQGLWALGAAIGTNIDGVGYAATTACVPFGVPSLPGGWFVAVGPGGKIFTSKDGGHRWSPATVPSGYAIKLNGVAGYVTPINTPTVPAFVFVAVGDGGNVLTSADGLTWTPHTSTSTTQNFNAVTLANGIFIAVGDTGVIRTSPDGVTWLSPTSNTSFNLHAVQCVSSTCYAVGDGGQITQSIDTGSTWTAQTLTGAPTLRAVAYGNYDNNVTNIAGPGTIGIGGTIPTGIDTWVAVGDGGVAFSNVNGAGWTPVPIAGAPNLTAIAYTSQFVALDAVGNAYTTQTATGTGVAGMWTAVGTTNLSSAAAIVSTGYGYVAVGVDGSNASSY